MRWVLGLIVILGLGLGVTWMLDPGDATPPPPPGDEIGENASEGTGFAEASTADDLDNGAEAATSSGSNHQRTDATATDSGPIGPTLLVMQGDPAVAVANAEVFFRDEAKHNRRKDARTRPINRYDAPRRDGMRAHTDSRGMVQLPGGTGRWLCSAQHGESFGFLVVTKRPGQHTITLGPDESVQIVVHQAGSGERPAENVPVAVLQQYRTTRSREIWRGITDERGRALVRHLQLMRRAKRTDQPKEFKERFAAVAVIPTKPVTLTEFDGRPATGEPVVLTLPPLGSIQAQLVDFDGKPLIVPATVGFSTSSTKQDGFPVRSSSLSQTVSKPAGKQPVTLPFAQVDQHVRLYARYTSDRRNAYSKPSKGPAAVGETALIKIPPLARQCVFSGRFLFANGQPLKSDTLPITIWGDDVVKTSSTAHTIANGHWDLVMSARTEKVRWRMEFRWQRSADGEGPAWYGAVVEFPGWKPGTRHEFGDIVLLPLPPLAAGTVVDDEGNPVANATISIQQERPKSNNTGNRPRNLSSLEANELILSSRLLSFENSNFASYSRGRQSGWRTLRHLSTKTGEDGTFAVYAPLPSGTLRVNADTSDHFATSLPLPAPTQDMHLQIPRNGYLPGMVMLPDWLPRRSVTVKLVPLEKERQKSETVSTRVSNRSPFILQPLRPGRYTLQVILRNIKTPIASIEDIFINPGKNEDPRTQPIDLRNALYQYHFEARDEAGRPFPLTGPIQAKLREPDGTEKPSALRWQNGKAKLITAHQSVELLFFGRGHMPKTQVFGPGNHEVLLTKVRPALVNLPGARALSGPTRKVRISALLQGDTGMPSSLNGVDQTTGRSFSFARWELGRTSGGWLEQTDVVEIPLMVPGKYQILFRAHATESTSTPQSSVNLGTFELKMDGSITTVPLDSQKISDALRKIDKQWQDRLERNRKRKKR